VPPAEPSCHRPASSSTLGLTTERIHRRGTGKAGREGGHPGGRGRRRRPGGRLPAADQPAATITWLLSDDASDVNGAILPSDGGWSAI